MKFIKNSLLPFLSRVCVTTVAVTYIFFFFAQSVSTEARAISFRQYLFLFVYSLALAATFLLFRLPLSKPLLVLMHYASGAAAFFIIFSFTKNLTFATTARFFVALMLYTVIYAVLGGLYALLRAVLGPTEDEKAKKGKNKKGAAKPSYEKRF